MFTISVVTLLECLFGTILLSVGLFVFISQMIDIIKYGFDMFDFILLYIGGIFIALGLLSILCSTGILIIV